MTKEQKIKEIHPDIEILSILNNRVKIKDRYGICEVQYHSLISGSKPSIATSIDKKEYFKAKLREVQPDLIVIGDYIDTKNKILIKNKYGICNCLPHILLKGSSPSIETAIDKTDYFINQANEIHQDRYNYSKVNYRNNVTNITITCSKHGDFNQTPHNHLHSNGCLECSNEDKAGGWYKNPKNMNKLACFYILKLENSIESFLKYGVTIDLKRRIRDINDQSGKIYKITQVKVINGTAEYCKKLEDKSKERIKKSNISYKPLVKFCGKNECFKPKIK